MEHQPISAQEMLQTRVARFKQVRPFPKMFIDTVIPEYKREIFSIIGQGVNEDPDSAPAITEQHCFSVGMIKMEAGQGAGLHAHSTEEVFIPLDGKLTVFWGDEGENELELEQWDTISVPIGVMRGFRNSDNKTIHVMAIVGGHDGGRLEWDQKLLDKAKEFGGELDETGHLVKE